MTLACPSEDALLDFVGKRLADAEALAVEEHLDRCTKCRTLLAILASALVPGATAVDVGTTRVDEAPPTMVEDTRVGPPRPHGVAVDDTIIGRYRITRVLGKGGMGIVYAAHDPELDRAVALKVLLTREPAQQERLLREARSMARLTHPNVVSVYDAGATADGRVFVAMELVLGRTLRSVLDAEPGAPFRATLRMFLAAGRGLAAAHAIGIVHRDFKPDNVLVGDDGRVLVTDFGLARASSSLVEGEPTGDAPLSFKTALTRAGSVMGTPRYMSPEQHRGDEVDARSDQFSFCVALWHAAYKMHAFEAATIEELALAAMKGAFVPPTKGHRAPRELRVLLERGLQPNPRGRHASMTELLSRLAPLERSSRAPFFVLAGALLLAVAVVGVISVNARRAATDPHTTAASVSAAHATCTLPPAFLTEASKTKLREKLAKPAFGVPAVPSEPVLLALDRHATALNAASARACALPPDLRASAESCIARMARRATSTVDVIEQGFGFEAWGALEAVQVLDSPSACTGTSARPDEAEWTMGAAMLQKHDQDLGHIAARTRVGGLRTDSKGGASQTQALLSASEIAQMGGAKQLAAEARLLAVETMTPDDPIERDLLADTTKLASASRRDDYAARAWILRVRALDLRAPGAADTLDLAKSAVGRASDVGFSALLTIAEAESAAASGDPKRAKDAFNHAFWDVEKADDIVKHAYASRHYESLARDPAEVVLDATDEIELAKRLFGDTSSWLALAELHAAEMKERRDGPKYALPQAREARRIAAFGLPEKGDWLADLASGRVTPLGARVNGILARSYALEARVLVTGGDLVGARAAAVASLSYEGHGPAREVSALPFAAMSLVERTDGHAAAALEYARRAVASLGPRAWSHTIVMVRMELARAAMASGRAAEARSAFEPAAPLLEAMPRDFRTTALAFLATIPGWTMPTSSAR